MAEKVTVRGITRDLAFEIAKHVDNRYMPERDSFVFAPGLGQISLSTNKCDSCSFIRMIHDGECNLTSVMVLGDYTDGWQDVHPGTMERITGILSPLQGDGDTGREANP